MTKQQAEKRVLSQAAELNVTDEKVIELCVKMYLNNPKMKSSKIKKNVLQMLRTSKPFKEITSVENQEFFDQQRENQKQLLY